MTSDTGAYEGFCDKSPQGGDTTPASALNAQEAAATSAGGDDKRRRRVTQLGKLKTPYSLTSLLRIIFVLCRR